MPAGGRRPRSGSKPGTLTTRQAVARAPAATATTVQNDRQHREALRDEFRGFMSPQRFRGVLTELYAMATEPGSRAERFRAIDLLLRLSIGNPAVYGEAAEAAGGTDGARSLAELVSALPPGTALVRAAEGGAAAPAGEWAPGDYSPPAPAAAHPPGTP